MKLRRSSIAILLVCVAPALSGCAWVAATSAVAGVSAATGERSHKGDRLQVAPKHTSTVSSTVVTTLSRPPIGCEPVFSGLADPKRSHVFGRCVS